MFVVNHQRHASTIEQFRLDDYAASSNFKPAVTAHHVRSWSHPSIVSPNAIAPISPTSFFVTNDHFFTRRLPSVLGKVLPLLETLLALPLSWVDKIDLIDGEIKITRALSRMSFANGVALSSNGRELAVVSTNLMEVYLYDRDIETNTLSLRATIPVPFAPDNLSYDQDTHRLVVAGHPHFLSMLRLLATKGVAKAPSWVVEVIPTQTSENFNFAANDIDAAFPAHRRAPVTPGYQLRTLYQSNGSHYQTSSTAIRHGKHLLTVGLYAQGILHCRSSPSYHPAPVLTH
jgi:hypothetical protein